MEKINPTNFALSLGAATLFLAVICLIFVAILPLNIMINITNSLFHGIDISSIATKSITLSSVITGIIIWIIIAVITGYMLALTYNKLGGKK